MRCATRNHWRSAMTPYFQDDLVTLYHGDCRDVLPTLGTFDAAIIDPPYGETSLQWDHWIPELPSLLAEHTSSMWCFGSLRMFLNNVGDFADWKLSQDVVWEKHNGSGFHTDRFKRVHENAVHWYRGDWSDVYHETPKTMDATKRAVRRKGRPAHTGEIADSTYVSEDGGPRLMRSVIFARSMHGRALHPTEKPGAILEPLVEYAVPPLGSFVDATAGSCSSLVIAQATARRAVGIEGDERYCEIAANRLAQGSLFGDVA
jgi:site-specific DNA-methyltransferase (adenine-specific)